MKRFFLSVHSVVIVILILSFFNLNCVTAEDVRRTKEMREEGKRIVTPVTEALRHYYADHQKYPERIKELEPKYIEKVPDAVNNTFTFASTIEKGRGFSYVYQLDSDSEYTISLSFSLAGSNSCNGGARNGEITVVWGRCSSAM